MVNVFVWKRREQRATFHQEALFEAGYLREVTFAVSNDRPLAVVHAIRRRSPPAFPDEVWNFIVIKRSEANVLTVVIPSDAIDKLSQAVREADMDLRMKAVNYE